MFIGTVGPLLSPNYTANFFKVLGPSGEGMHRTFPLHPNWGPWLSVLLQKEIIPFLEVC